MTLPVCQDVAVPQTTRPSGEPLLVPVNGIATADDTIAALLERASRRSRSVPLSKTFVQQGVGGDRSPGPLASLVHRGDERALDLLLLTHAVATAAPYDIREAAAVWARSLDLGGSDSALTAVSKAFRRLEDRKLIARRRIGRQLQVTLLEPDGSGDPYRPPSRYLKLPFSYWEDGWHRRLNLPGKAILLIALSLADGFYLPAERVPAWYGISPDSFERGVADLKGFGILGVQQVAKKAPLAPAGFTIENRYTLRPPFGPRGVLARGAPLPEEPS